MKLLLKDKLLLSITICAVVVIGFVAFAKYRIKSFENVDLDHIKDFSLLERWRSELSLYQAVHILGINKYQEQSKYILQQEAWNFEDQGNYRAEIRVIDAALATDHSGEQMPYILKYYALVKSDDYADAVNCAKDYRSMLVSTNQKEYVAKKGAPASTYALEAYAYRKSKDFTNALEALKLGTEEVGLIAKTGASTNDYIFSQIERASSVLFAEACLLYSGPLDTKAKAQLETMIMTLQPYCSNDSYILMSKAVYRLARGEVLKANDLPSGQELSASFYCKYYGFEQPEIPQADSKLSH